MRRIAGIVLALGSVSLVQARCGLATYSVQGKVQDAQTKAEIGEARVYVFLDSNVFPLPVLAGQSGPGWVATSQDGAYHATGYLDTFKKARLFGIGEDCSLVPAVVTVFVLKKGYVGQRTIVGRKEFRARPTGQRGKFVIDLPVVQLYAR